MRTDAGTEEQREMNRMRGLAVVVGVAALMAIGVACGGAAPEVAGSMAPDLRLTFQGVEYAGVEVVGAATSNGAVVCCGTPINMDKMEVVGTGVNHYPDRDAIAVLYRPKAGDTTDVYTFHPAQTIEASEEPVGTDTAPATWTRWEL
jgi:hypothetical protein